ncbi:MAG: nucleotidyltransferase domain-containing protein [Zoogloea sp.]|uniref:nucleotidyltransferase family protein n=1 Tax=Zoogloea sp. TaxID=49181 RepID=UPI0026181FC6|nr:nucleotidyltransferase domain-containing protein [Zoogloea sp.]MDD3329550.1 nucleotidyltransferase domain-containing protein [Zoogloea sp.]
MPRADLAQLDLAPRHLALLQDILASHVPEAEVWAYGSRVHGTAHEGSDLDLVLRHPDDPAKDVANWPALQEALQASPLPMLVEVQLWNRLPAGFHPEIERRYVVVQGGGGHADSLRTPARG